MTHELDQCSAPAPGLPTTIELEPAPVSDQDAQAPVASEAPASPPSEPMVIIRKGQAPVARKALLQYYNPNCGLCKEGWTTELKHGVNVPVICLCTVIRFERAARETAKANDELQKAIQTPRVMEAPRPEMVEAAERRITRLSSDVEKLEGELKARGDEFTASLSDLDTVSSQNNCLDRDLNLLISTHSQHVKDDQVALADAERAISLLRQQLAAGLSALAQAKEHQAILAATLKDVAAERERRQDDFAARTRRLRRDLEKARARLARARGYMGLAQPETTE